MRRSIIRALRSLVGLGVALPLVVPMATAYAQLEPDVEWISESSGEIGGRELPAISADGRYVVFVGRSSSDMGVWLRDRVAGESHRLTTGSHFNPAISADGSTVAYAQYGGASQGIYVLDWQTSTTPQLVSVDDDGQTAGVPVDFPALSGSGRYVAFQASSSVLDDDASPGKTGGGPSKVYVRDRYLGDTEMVSVTSDGQIVNGNANRPGITPDGRYVVFSSDASVLAVGETTDAVEALAEEEETTVVHVYRHDRQTGETAMASVASDGTPGDGASALAYGPTVTDDGSKVAFESDATNLVGGDTNGNTDAFVHDFAAGITERVSLDSNGDEVVLENPESVIEVAGDEAIDLTSNAGSGPAISGNGRYVAFESDGALTPDDVNTPDPVEYYNELPVYTTDVYMLNLDDGTLVRSSAAMGEGAVEATGVRTDGMGNTSPANNGADPAINVDGRLVAFVSNGNLTGELPPPEEGEAAEEPAETEALWEPEVWARFDPTIPADEPTDPGDDPTDPGEDPTDPGEDPTDPGEDPTDPGDGTTLPFKDVASDNVFYAAIEWMWESGLTAGCNAAGDMYCPTESVSRAQMATFFVRMLGLSEGADVDRFVDDDGSVHERNINRLAAAGITVGCNPEGDEFCPNDSVSRAQMATMFVRALGLTGGGDNDRFVDDDGSVHEANIDRIAEAGITVGCNPEGDRYCPSDDVSRQQMAAFFKRSSKYWD